MTAQIDVAVTSGANLSHYRILSLLGKGGMGEVYLAEDTRLGRRVALKLLSAGFTKDEDRVRRFQQEARAASALNHPNILTIYEIGQADAGYFIATEFIDGVTLRQRLKQTKILLPDVLDIAIQAAGALSAAHQAGIVHRDIKPENIMLRTDGYIKVLDFGLAKLTEKVADRQTTNSEAATIVKVDTTPGMVMGTVNYMSPEQARGLEVDERSDIFSLGVVIYEMAAGRAPFAGLTPTDVIISIIERDPLPLKRLLPEAPAELEWIVSKALCKNCEKRYQTAKEITLDLKSLKQRLEIEAELGRSIQQGLSGRRSSTRISKNVTAESHRESGGATSGSTSTASRRQRSRKAIDSLAVLPLTNASADPNTEYLSDGITESIINILSQLPKLRVVPRSTVFRYKGRVIDPQELGRELGVRAVLTGRVLQLGDTLVVKTELIDVANESHLWGEQYKRKFTDIFALQEEISEEISEKLRLRLTGQEKKRLTKRYTENTEAYQLYLKGRYYWNKRTQEWIRKGIECFQQAIDLDPNYALAYAGLADSYALLGSATVGLSPHEVYPKAKAAAMKALELDDSLAEAHTTLGFFRLLYDWDWAAAEQEFKRATELNPNYASAHDGYGFYFKVMGQLSEAIRECKRAQELDPLSLFINISLGWVYYFSRRYTEAIEYGKKILEMDPNFFGAYWLTGVAYQQEGMYSDAIASFQKAISLSGGGLNFVAYLGQVYAIMGQKAEAYKTLDELKKLSQQRYVSPFYIAVIYIGLGEKDQAFEWLNRACEERSSLLAFVKVEPMFDSLRSDPRFAQLQRRIGFSQ